VVEIDHGAFGCPRDVVIDALRAEGIEATLHYPAVHLLTLYRERGGVPGTTPRAEEACERLVTLPLYPTMTSADQDDVVVALHRIQAWAAARATAL
jgi:dTDP-4-amino-4,6-dideoxygalactose transaminase